MLKHRKGGKLSAVIVLFLIFIAVLIFTAAALYAKTKVKTDEREGPRKLITAYMDALKNKDFDRVFEILEFNADKKVLDAIKKGLSNEDYFVWRISGYKITDVKADGGFAKVYVSETDYKEFKDEAKRMDEVVTPGVSSVKETFYLIKDEGKWRIDPSYSWIDFRTFPLTAEEFKKMDGTAINEKIKTWLDTIGFGQAFTILADRNLAPALSLIIPDFFPEITRTKAENQWIACQSNLKNIATALEMYSTDNAGRYPTSLKQLAPDYLRSIPTCPAAGKDTYSSSYTSSQNPDAFTVYCSGNNHKDVDAGENYPMYNSDRGLTPKQNDNVEKDKNDGNSGKG